MGSGRRLVPDADQTCFYLLPDLRLHEWRPEPLGDDEHRSFNSRMT